MNEPDLPSVFTGKDPYVIDSEVGELEQFERQLQVLADAGLSGALRQGVSGRVTSAHARGQAA